LDRGFNSQMLLSVVRNIKPTAFTKRNPFHLQSTFFVSHFTTFIHRSSNSLDLISYPLHTSFNRSCVTFKHTNLDTSSIRTYCSQKTTPENQNMDLTSNARSSRFLSIEPKFPRYSYDWWKEIIIICTVFAITGSSAVYFVKPFLHNVIGLEGSLKEGPWSYRLLYLTFMMPMYSIMLMFVGTIFGRQAYFKKFVIRMWSRFLPANLKKRLN